LLWNCTFPSNIRQILIELHDGAAPFNFKAQQLFLGLAHAGYTIVSKEPNTLGCGGGCVEYSFIRTSLPIRS
jgi:hypothetical protein